jgi:hypothetical protein
MAAQYPKFVEVEATADGDNTLIAAVAGKQIRVLAFALTVSIAGTITLQDTDNTDLATFVLPASGGVSFAGTNEAPAFETAQGKGLEVTNPAGLDTLGFITYVEV